MKLKYRFPVSMEYIFPANIRFFVFIGLILISMPTSVYGMKPIEDYNDNQCQLIAKDVCKEYASCSLVWIQPLQDNGAIEISDFSAHIINKVYFPGSGTLYWDYGSGAMMTSIEEVHTWYYWYSGGKKAEIYDLMVERPPWGMTWHY